MTTYNFAKSSKKDDKNLSDMHTEMRLKEKHIGKDPNVVTEKQLAKKDRNEDDFNVITEKLLEKARTGSADVILEKNLNDSKGMFGSKFRNPESHSGDINKLEEKRLSGNNVEKEKYSASSDTPKEAKWWDALRKASEKNRIKTAQSEEMVLGDPNASFGRLTDEEDENNTNVNFDEPVVNFEEPDGDIGSAPDSEIYITKNKEGKAPMPHIYMEMKLDPSSFGGDVDAMKEAALQKILEVRPNLVGKVTAQDLSDPQGEGLDSTIRMRLIGEEYFAPVETAEDSVDSPFISAESEEVEVGGTPMTVGKVELSEMAEGMDRDELLQGLKDYIAEKTGLEVPEDVIQINMDKRQAVFTYNVDAVTGALETPAVDQGVDEDEDEDNGLDVMVPGKEGEDEVTDEMPPIPTPTTSTTPTVAKSIYDFPIVIADSKKK